MRANKLINYMSILQVLGEPGCPFCRFMKDFQARALQTASSKTIEHLCNFHTWGFAAMRRAPLAADLFLSLLQRESRASPNRACDICVVLWEEEDRRIRELISCLNQTLVVRWLRSQAILCSIHGDKLKRGARLIVGSTIQIIIERYRKQLADELATLRDDYQSGDGKLGVVRTRRGISCVTARPAYLRE